MTLRRVAYSLGSNAGSSVFSPGGFGSQGVFEGGNFSEQPWDIRNEPWAQPQAAPSNYTMNSNISNYNTNSNMQAPPSGGMQRVLYSLGSTGSSMYGAVSQSAPVTPSYYAGVNPQAYGYADTSKQDNAVAAQKRSNATLAYNSYGEATTVGYSLGVTSSGNVATSALSRQSALGNAGSPYDNPVTHVIVDSAGKSWTDSPSAMAMAGENAYMYSPEYMQHLRNVEFAKKTQPGWDGPYLTSKVDYSGASKPREFGVDYPYDLGSTPLNAGENASQYFMRVLSQNVTQDRADEMPSSYTAPKPVSVSFNFGRSGSISYTAGARTFKF